MLPPRNRFEVFCDLGRARRDLRLATRLFDPIHPERAPALVAEVTRLEGLMKAIAGERVG